MLFSFVLFCERFVFDEDETALNNNYFSGEKSELLFDGVYPSLSSDGSLIAFIKDWNELKIFDFKNDSFIIVPKQNENTKFYTSWIPKQNIVSFLELDTTSSARFFLTLRTYDLDKNIFKNISENGEVSRALVSYGIYPYKWSPNGNYVAYFTQMDKLFIVDVGIPEPNKIILPNDIYSSGGILWSMNSDSLYISNNHEIQLYDNKSQTLEVAFELSSYNPPFTVRGSKLYSCSGTNIIRFDMISSALDTLFSANDKDCPIDHIHCLYTSAYNQQLVFLGSTTDCSEGGCGEFYSLWSFNLETEKIKRVSEFYGIELRGFGFFPNSNEFLFFSYGFPSILNIFKLYL